MFKSCRCQLRALRLGADYVILLGLSFFIRGLGLHHPHPGLLGEEVRGQKPGQYYMQDIRLEEDGLF